RPDSVRETLASIAKCRYPAERCEVIVVDNATAGDAAVRLEKPLPGDMPVRVVRETEPGLSNARNKGLETAAGEIVVFADDDVTVDREWLTRLALPFAGNPRVGATSGLTLPGALETPTQRWIEGFGGRIGGFDIRTFDLDDPPPDRPLFPFTVGDLGAGRNMAFRRHLLQRLGGFDPALGPGTVAHDGDDIEALLRVLLSGHTIVHDPAAIVWHAHPLEYRELEQRVWGYGIGLTACLTKAAIDHPGLLLDIVRKLPRGLAFALSSSSEKNRGRQADFPRPLVRRELLGMAYGPIAYLRSRRRARRRQNALHGVRRRSLCGGDEKLRVLVVSDEYQPVVGGAARSAELLTRHMSERGHRVVIATAWQPNAPAFELEGEVEIHRIRDLTSRAPWLSEDPYRHHAPPFPDPEATLQLRRLIRDFRPDVVHAYGWLAHTTAAAMVGIGTPLLLSARDYGNFCAVFTLVRKGERCSGPSPVKCLTCASSTYGPAKGALATASVFGSKPLLRHKVTAIHGVSRFVAGEMDRHLAVPGAFSAIVPNFHEEDDGPVDQEIMAQLPTEPYIQFVGHLRRYKGIYDLLAAYDDLDDPPPLVLVGTRGPDTPERFPDRVTVLTYVPHATVMAMWEQALFAVAPSIAPEALGNVVHEAMSKGCAVIGATPGGHEDMIDDGETGLLVPGGDPAALKAAMARLIGDASLRERLGRAAVQRARRYTPQVVMPELERLYYDTIRHFEKGRA
ncbi:MAG: glycosyltransferase, partial [Solirubrobacterales bacterium]